jgi:hypothetical protein
LIYGLTERLKPLPFKTTTFSASSVGLSNDAAPRRWSLFRGSFEFGDV